MITLGQTISPKYIKEDGALKQMILHNRAQESGVPRPYRNRRITDVKNLFSDVPEIYQTVEKFLLNLEDYYVSSKRQLHDYPKDPSNIGKGFIFIDEPSSSRSLALVSAILMEVDLAYYCRTRLMPFAEYLSEVKKSFGKETFPDQSALNRALLRDYIETAPVAAITELGGEHSATGSDFGNSELFRVLKNRYYAAKPTLLTTTIPQSSWSQEKFFGSFAGGFMRNTEVFTVLDLRNRR